MLDLDDEAPAVTWFGEHRAPVESLTVNSAGTVLVSTDYRGEAVFWDARTGRRLRLRTIDGDPAAWARWACAMANRELTPTESKRYVGADRPRTRLCPSS
jgi:WD40 repeat protein